MSRLLHRDAQQLCPVHGHPREGKPLGPLDAETASRPAPHRPSSDGCWAKGQQAGLCMGGPVTPMSQCHSDTTQQSQCPGEV